MSDGHDRPERWSSADSRILLSLISGFLLMVSGCVTERAKPPPGTMVVSKEQQSSWVRNFNPLLPSGARYPARAGIYEPLMIFNSVKGVWVPWLATAYVWSEDHGELTFDIREGVRWSDGQPFGPKDIVFTFELMKRFRALDGGDIWGFLDSVEAVENRQVKFVFSRPFVPGLQYLAHQPIVAEHIWGQIDDPTMFANETPVGTGPFTEVRLFSNQVYELARNPHYWQPGKPHVDSLRFPAFPSNDQANAALLAGEIDWAGNFVPAIERIFVDRNPEHHHYWFPPVGTMVFLYPNTKRPPFDDVRVRQALSAAIDREQVVKVAMYDYTYPAHPTGLSDAYAGWRLKTVHGEQVTIPYEPGRADELLDDAGLPRVRGGQRYDVKGQPLEFEILVVSGWSDWVRAAQVIARGLRERGLDVKVKSYDFSAWFDRVQKGDFDLAVGWSVEGPSPYGFFRWLMSQKTVKEVGQIATNNWHRFGSVQVDTLLDQFEKTSKRTEQQEIVHALQRIMVESLPAIPLFANPSWAAFSTARFTGFPNKTEPYANPSPNAEPEVLLVLTQLKPKERVTPP